MPLTSWKQATPVRPQQLSASAPDPLTGIAQVQPALPIAEAQLRQFVTSPHFTSSIQQAFGGQAQAQTAYHLLQSYLQADPQHPPVNLAIAPSPAAQLQGAFAASTNTIYLFDTFLQQAQQPETIASVYLEELGHWLDAQLNITDTAGDEGAIFSALVQQQAIAPDERVVLQSENDWAWWHHQGQALAIEQSWSWSREEERTGNWLAGSFCSSTGNCQYQSELRSNWSHDQQATESQTQSQESDRSAHDWGNSAWGEIDYRTQYRTLDRSSRSETSEARHFTPEGHYNPNRLRWSNSFSLSYGQWQTTEERIYANSQSQSVSVRNLKGDDFANQRMSDHHVRSVGAPGVMAVFGSQSMRLGMLGVIRMGE